MSVEVGNQLQVAYIAEVTPGTTPGTPTGQALRFVTFSLAADRNYLKNPELRTDRQNAAGRGGCIVGKGELGGVFSYATYDDFLAAALCSAWDANVVKIGTTKKTFTIEKKYLVNTLCFPFTHVVVDSFELSGKADQNIEIKFGLIAGSCGTETGTTIWTSVTPANTNAVHTSWQGSVKKGGVAVGTVTSWTLKGNNKHQEAKVCGSANLYDLRAMSADITGTIDLYFDSYSLYTDFRAENTVALQINIGDGTTKSYVFDLASCKITKHGAPSTADGLVSVTVEFESYTHSDTALKITRIPGA